MIIFAYPFLEYLLVQRQHTSAQETVTRDPGSPSGLIELIPSSPYTIEKVNKK